MRFTHFAVSLALAIAAVLSTSKPAAAQFISPALSDTIQPVDSLTSVLAAAEQARSYLRLTMKSQNTYSGYIFRIVPDSQWVHIGARRASFPAIERVELRHKEGGLALWGAVIGAAGLGLLAAAIDDPDADCTFACGSWVVNTGAVLFGGFVGTLTGIVIDPGETRWEELWSDE